uniref:Gamma-glutamyltransferase n=1 Tax=Paramoeba aestuarina TaxID=180227 RepID=A0A7S4L3X7_9EUKA|eukprot:CAMPEP_0201511418 /NCGR_PEP_ID=MMETSP0161_2-20130828/3885_1 /ASSEMBLY_ACC=CAM_ASM_000251 /TAXON_ID=180227 /ORGANISM="Neoparamoeba aestuarina, Strain SoJaBio B1-5/56/2" /LENGTH=620 /DNA_ID=CAMNT_0047906911 /DNA_START=57 /DNA_END=1919 /DNA_ORIENTATION=-
MSGDRSQYGAIEEGKEPDYEAQGYQNEALPAKGSGIFSSRKYIISAVCIGILVAFLVVIVLIVGVDILEGDDDGWWEGKPSEYKNAAVAAESPVCSNMGVDILQKGGNAIDAMVTTDLCVGIVHCFATNMGGGGVTVLRTPGGKVEVIDFREKAPAAATADMYTNGWSSTVGTLAGGVPGTFKGLYEVHAKYGELDWSEVVLPAAQLARAFEVDYNLANALVDGEENILADPGLSSVFAPDGEILKQGDLVAWDSLADTLEKIATNGIDEFYNGTIGQNFIDDMVASNPETIMTFEDIQSYSVEWRDPVEQHYRGYKIYGAPPPFSGGPIIAQALNILEMYNLPRLGDNVKSQHYMLQTMNYGYSDKTGIGDPSSTYNKDNDMEGKIKTMITKDHAADLREHISSSTTFPPEHYIDLFPLTTDTDGGGTSHFSIVDEKGYAVACTTTVNTNFGAYFMSPSTGLILNDEQDDFNNPAEPEPYFGTAQSPSNYPGPGLRPTSSMSPTIVTKNNDIYLVLGGSGGKRIITGTFQVLLNFMDFGLNLQDAVNRPRFHDQWVEPIVQWDDGYDEEWRKDLKNDYGYNVSSKAQTSTSVVQAIFKSSSGNLYAACDRRKVGKPAGY